MQRVEIVPFEVWHFEAMDVRKEDLLDIEAFDMGTLVQGWKTCETVLVDGEPAFFYGSNIDEEGRGYLWAVSSPLVERVALSLTRGARARIKQMSADGAWIVNAYCHKKNERSLRWLQDALGMSIVDEMDDDRWWLAIYPDEVRYV